jgi:hypothetical protein
MSETRLLRRAFGPKREEVMRGRKIVCKNMHCWPNIVRVHKSRRVKLAESVVCTGKMRRAHKILISL